MARRDRVRAAVAAVAICLCLSPAHGAGRYGRLPASAMSEPAQVQLPQTRACAPAPPTHPYGTPSARRNTTGMLDLAMVGDAINGAVLDFDTISDGLQATTELLDCELDNSASLLVAVPATAAECPQAPAAPYQRPPYGTVQQGANSMEVIRIVQGGTSYGLFAAVALNDLQGRLERIRCSERRLQALVSERYRAATLRPLEPSDCQPAPVTGAYVEQFPNVPWGTGYYNLAINRLNGNQGAIDHWLEDLQSRIGAVACEQAFLLQSVDRLSRAPAAAEQVARTGRGPSAAARRMGPREALGAAEASDPERCPRAPPEQSFVRRHSAWACSPDGPDCTQWDVFLMKLLVLLSEHNERIGDDLQSRLTRLICLQREINEQLTALTRTAAQ